MRVRLDFESAQILRKAKPPLLETSIYDVAQSVEKCSRLY